MSYNVKPGDRAVIINSVNGKAGPSVGRVVMVHADAPLGNSATDNEYVDRHNALNDPLHYCPPSPYEKEHTVLGKIWPVTDVTGKPFMDNNGNIREFGEVPDRWLEKVLPPPPVVAGRETVADYGNGV